jgi:hypothetical protein
MKTEYQSFEEFYPHYLSEHSKPMTRALHLLGITLALTWTVLCLFVWGQFWWILAGLVFGYGPSWIAHFFIEKNRPATFKFPLYSLRGDLRMALDILRNQKLMFEKNGK